MTPLLAEVQRQEWYVIIAAAVIALGVVAFGWRDVTRFAFRRVRAIAGICFTEAIRRRVLWITPLAIIGVVAVSQLTRPFDEQDAIRQTTRYCLFGAGVIVIVSAVLLACTNLPKEIENRVIFTIVTKPTTRLEIVLGKVMGFAMVSGVMLLIMGVFTLGYLELRAWSMISNARSELAVLDQQEKSNATPTTGLTTQPGGDLAIATNRRARQQALRRYIESGLLTTKAVQWPADFQIYARDPGVAGADATQWLTGNQQTFCTVPLPLPEEKKRKPHQGIPAEPPVRLPGRPAPGGQGPVSAP